ncbi:MAG TPA: DUF4160 domain-containing protein [Stellaceae bacterium]|nr:DUF4160 domain-containing protein [Stellaceae bacterium]
MPEISRFFGIIIRMFYADHEPAHFHAVYGEHEALIAIETLVVLRGSLPRRRSPWCWSGRRSTGRRCGRTGSGLGQVKRSLPLRRWIRMRREVQP